MAAPAENRESSPGSRLNPAAWSLPVAIGWLQYPLLPAFMPAYKGFVIVLIAALGLSWLTAPAIRRILAVAGVV